MSGAVAGMLKGSFFANVDFGLMLGLPLAKGVHLTTSLIFETANMLSVMGSVAHMLNTLGHPEEEDTTWNF